MAHPFKEPDAFDAELDTNFGSSVSPAVSGIVTGLAEVGGEDAVGPDLPRGVALVVWIMCLRLSKKLGINIRPHTSGRWLLNMAVIALKRLSPPDIVRRYWATSIGEVADAAWDGILDGVRMNASRYLNEWSREKNDAARKKLMDPAAYAKAEAFVNKFLDGGKTETKSAGDSTASTASGFGKETDYYVHLIDLEESDSADDRALAAEFTPLWEAFIRRLPKHADYVTRGSLLGFVPIKEITDSLRANQTDLVVDDPENPGTKISSWEYKLKILAGMAKDRVDARALTLVSPPKEPVKLINPYHPGRDIVFDRRDALNKSLRRSRGGGFAPPRHWKTIVGVAAVFVLGLSIAFAVAGPPPSLPRAPLTRPQVSSDAGTATDNPRVNPHP